jgi:hypothetical protein
MLTKNQFKEIERKLCDAYDDDITSSGSECMFINLDGKIGAKCYWDKRQRDVNYTCQKFASSYDLAPKAFFKFKIVDPVDSYEYYCHLTEVVEPMASWGYDNDFAESDEFEDAPYYEERMEWIDKLYAVTNKKFEYADFHTGNFGFFRGDVVCIDFDTCYSLYQMIKSGKLKEYKNEFANI